MLKSKASKRKKEDVNLEYLRNERSEKRINYLNRIKFKEFMEEEDYIMDDIGERK